MSRVGGAIVCLQEVCFSSISMLYCFFFNQGYYPTWCSYGASFTGHMGVMTAFPATRFTLTGVDMRCLADQLSGLCEEIYPRDDGHESTEEENNWRQAVSRRNVLLTLALTEITSGKKFVVANYHMPCAFELPTVMDIHTVLFLNHLSGLTNNFETPFVLCTDSNSKPDSESYRIITQGLTTQLNVLRIEPLKEAATLDYAKIQPMNRGLLSAYAVANGREPRYTNRCKHTKEFSATLDYIFFNRGKWEVVRVKPLPEGEEFLPNLVEPSDHVLLMAELRLK